MLVLDFETAAIEPGNPFPVPFAVALSDGREHRYIRGSLAHLRRTILSRMKGENEIVMHNGVGFDLGVAASHLDIFIESWRVQDTMVLAFLDDPYRPLGLKPLARELLNVDPEEQNTLKAWIIANVIGATPKNWGAFISQAPEALVKPYAIGDVYRTGKLYRFLKRRVKLDSMWPAYRREIDATPLLLTNELDGIKVDKGVLWRDAAFFGDILGAADDRIRKLLKAPKLDVDKHDQVAKAIERRFRLKLPKTPTGRTSTTTDTLKAAMPKGEAKSCLLYRSALALDLRTFILPWATVAQKRAGRIYTHWNLIRGTGRIGGGTRTGRLSSEPNLQNITSTEKREALLTALGKGYWPLPVIRDYVIPEDRSSIIIGRDYSQQELRLLAHFEGSDLCDLYNRFPDADLHQYVGEMIKGITGVDYPRKIIKVLNFCTIYGGGAPAIAAQSGMSLADATTARELYFQSLPTIREVMHTTQAEGRRVGIRTIGGRIYEAQSGFDDTNRMRDFAYRLLNYRIQGSAADQMKETLGQLWTCRNEWKDVATFYLSVHDELTFSCVKTEAPRVLKILDRVMLGTVETFKLKVPFKTDAYQGATWAKVKKG